MPSCVEDAVALLVHMDVWTPLYTLASCPMQGFRGCPQPSSDVQGMLGGGGSAQCCDPVWAVSNWLSEMQPSVVVCTVHDATPG